MSPKKLKETSYLKSFAFLFKREFNCSNIIVRADQKNLSGIPTHPRYTRITTRRESLVLGKQRRKRRPLSRASPLPKHCASATESGVARSWGSAHARRSGLVALPACRPGVFGSYRRTAIRSTSPRAATSGEM